MGEHFLLTNTNIMKTTFLLLALVGLSMAVNNTTVKFHKKFLVKAKAHDAAQTARIQGKCDLIAQITSGKPSCTTFPTSLCMTCGVYTDNIEQGCMSASDQNACKTTAYAAFYKSGHADAAENSCVTQMNAWHACMN